MSDERRKARLLLRAAAVLFAVSILSGFIPFRAGISYDPTRVVDCGSIFISAEWAGDEGCAAEFSERVTWAAGMLFVAVLLALVAGISRVVDRSEQD